MKIIQVHNYYQYSGGEDIVVKNEYELLKAYNHTVLQYTTNNSEIKGYNLLDKTNLIINATFSKKTYDVLTELFKKEKPDVCHVHNTFPLITPSVYYACKDAKIPVVQTLHNYRLLCSNAYFFRNGKVCEECMGKSLFISLKYGCYRNSRIQTFILARMIEYYKRFDAWNMLIDKYIVLTEFSKKKFIQGGLFSEKIFVKPNFLLNDPGFDYGTQKYFLFAGRLDVTKGINVLTEALKKIPEDIELVVAGDGMLKNNVINIKGIKYLGQLNHMQLLMKLKEAIALIFPSLVYETFGMIIVESFACGKPVIASNLGAAAEFIKPGKTGLLFEAGNSEELSKEMEWAYRHPEEMKRMGMNARKEYEEKYTAERNYKMLMGIYTNLRESVVKTSQ